MKKSQCVRLKSEQDFQKLFVVVLDGNNEKARKQLMAFSSVNFKNSSKSTLLITACQSKTMEKENLTFVQFLLQNGAYIMKKDASGRTAITYCEQHDFCQVKMLLCETIDYIIVENIVNFLLTMVFISYELSTLVKTS